MRLSLLLAALIAVFLFVLMAGTSLAAATLLLGDRSVESLQDNDAAGLAEAFSFSASASGGAQSISVYVDSGSSASGLAVGMYADNNRHPGSLLASGSTSAPVAGQWNDVTLNSTPTLSRGTSYWLAVLGTGGQLNFRDVNLGTGSCSENSSQSNLTSLPSSWTSGATFSTCSLSAYVNGAAGPTMTLAPANTALPTISGTAQQGQTLMVTDGTWANSVASYSYAWQDCDSSGNNCMNIDDATSSSYTLQASDVGATLRSVVTASNSGGSVSASSAATAIVAADPPAASFTYSPASPVTGQNVHFDASASTCSNTPCTYTWADNPPSGGSWPLGSGQTLDFTFQGTGTKYVTLTLTDASSYSATVEHDLVVTSPTITSPPVNTALPTVSGTATQGQVLTTSNGSWSGSPTDYSYQWRQCDSSGANCSDISGATQGSYTLAAGDVGHTIRVVVTATNAGGSTPATATQTGSIASSGDGPQTCTTTFTPSSIGSSPYPGSTVNSALQGASGGQTFCFAAGSYSAIDMYAAHPSSRVTLTPVAGATVTGISFNLNGVSNVNVTGFGPTNGSSSFGGILVNNAGQGNSSNLTISYNAMTSNGVQVTNNTLANANIDIAHSTFIGFASSGESDRLNIGSDSACPDGITVESNLINGGESDGMDIAGSCDTQILHNLIENVGPESVCNGIHCDGIQTVGDTGTVIAYNWLHNDSDCLLMDDGSNGDSIHDNVCDGTTDGYSMQFGGAVNLTMTHNTWGGPAGQSILWGADHSCNPSTNFTYTNNISEDGLPQLNSPTVGGCNTTQGTWGTEDYNLLSGGGGTGPHDINGSPTFTGGSSPSSWAGWALTSGSLGAGNASDGLDRGASDFSITTGA